MFTWGYGVSLSYERRKLFRGIGGRLRPPLTNLRVWLKADAITGLNDTDPVATWVDSSGAGNDATQGTAADRPIYRTNIVNGLPIVRFDGVSDFLECPYTASDAGDPNQAWFAVFRTTSTVTQQLIYWMGETVNAGGFGPESEIHFGVASAVDGNNIVTAYLGRAFPATGSNVAFTDTTNFHILTAKFTALLSTSPTAQIFLDGTAGSVMTGTLAEQLNWMANSRVGRPSIAVRFFGGDLAELLVYNADMTSQQSLVEAYLRTKYAL